MKIGEYFGESSISMPGVWFYRPSLPWRFRKLAMPSLRLLTHLASTRGQRIACLRNLREPRIVQEKELSSLAGFDNLGIGVFRLPLGSWEIRSNYGLGHLACLGRD